MHLLKKTVSSLSAAAILLASTPFSFAALQGSIKIEQISAGPVGVWTLLSEDGSSIASEDEGINKLNYSVAITRFGQTTLSVNPPPGMVARITVFRGNERITQTDAQQYSFTLFANDNYRFVVQYALSQLGSLGVTSEPAGARFRMRGPTGRTYAGKTPKTFDNLPAGRYTVMFAALEGCTQPARKNAVVKAEERNTIHVTQACGDHEDLIVLPTRTSRRSIIQSVEDRENKPIGQRN